MMRGVIPLPESPNTLTLNLLRVTRVKPSESMPYKFRFTVNVEVAAETSKLIDMAYENGSGQMEADEMAYCLHALAQEIQKVSNGKT